MKKRNANIKRENQKSSLQKYIIIFDDIGNELRNPLVNQLLKTNRHYRSKVILLSQYVNDLSPESRKQIDYWILFGGHKIEKLPVIYNDADLNIPLETFLALYNHATDDKYGFLYIETRESNFRKDFDKMYKISE